MLFPCFHLEDKHYLGRVAYNGSLTVKVILEDLCKEVVERKAVRRELRIDLRFWVDGKFFYGVRIRRGRKVVRKEENSGGMLWKITTILNSQCLVAFLYISFVGNSANSGVFPYVTIPYRNL